MRWNERLHLALPELARVDARVLIAGAAVGAAAQFVWNHSIAYIPIDLVVALPSAKLLVWAADLTRDDRLYTLEVARRRKAYRKGQEHLRKLRRRAAFVNPGGILPDFLRRRNPYLADDDHRVIERIEDLADEIERQFDVCDTFVQRQLQRVLDQVIGQAIHAMEDAQKLGLLLEFLSKEDLVRLEAEEQELRTRAHDAGVGPVATLHSQTCRFKAQQIANVRNAQRNAALFRAHLYALEAGLGNVRGRMASIVAFRNDDLFNELDALDAELAALDEGMRLAARSIAGDYYHAARQSQGPPPATEPHH